MQIDEKTRCGWVGNSQIYIDYHDNEWGVPLHDERRLFEMLILEGMQAGLSWITVLKKRENYRDAFDNFDPEKIALYDNNKIEQLLKNDGIIKNRLKVNAIVQNAKCYLQLIQSHGSLDNFLWRYVDYTPIINNYSSLDQLPANTPLSDTISRDLKKLGFKFIGTTIIYSYMQAIGMVNDHLTVCFCRRGFPKQ